MPAEIGRTILNKYRIERLLGEGAFGYVYEAYDVNLQRRVAIKEFRTELADDASALRRFKSEAIAISQLSDPHIVTIWSWEQEGNQHYMVLEFMDGGSLANLLTQRSNLSQPEAAIITRAVCDGLAAAHCLNIVHRDIKPANILLNRDGSMVKLTDFGIAHVPAALSDLTNITHIGSTMGTAWYMSPEQARGQKVDQRSDLYSVGAMLYEMIAGYRYLNFTGDFLSDLEMLESASLRPLPADTPAELQQLIARALAKDPAQRFQTAEEMSAALLSFVAPGATVSIPIAPASALPASRTPIRPLMLVGAAVGSLLLLAIAGLFFSGLMSPAKPTLAAVVASSTASVVVATPTDAQTEIARIIFATQTAQAAQAEATRIAGEVMAVRVAASLTAAAPTITLTPTATLTPTLTPAPLPTQTPTVAPTPAPSPTRGLIGIALVSPPKETRFRTENSWIVLEWKPNPSSFTILAENEWYRVQVRTPDFGAICTFYTKDTEWTLPPSGQSGGGCDTSKWQFNTMQMTEWRVSLVVRVDNVVGQDIEKSNSEGWIFRWNK